MMYSDDNKANKIRKTKKTKKSKKTAIIVVAVLIVIIWLGNTLERYAKKYETKPVKKKSEKRKEYIDEIPVTDENTGSEETDYMPDNPSNLFDLLEDSDET